MTSEQDELLVGGNVSSVYRSGNTVRRNQNHDSSKIHKLLLHLEDKDFIYSPKFMGVDENGREVLSYIEGEAGNDPVKDYMRSNLILKEIANMLRLYHDSVCDFDLLSDWEPMINTPDLKEVICHNDFALYNIIFKDERPVGIIDFDVAAPGPRLWDIAYTLYTCVPLSRITYNEEGNHVYYDQSVDAPRKKERINIFFEAYGLKGVEKGLFEMVILRIEGLCRYIVEKANHGNIAFQKMIKEGHLEHYREDVEFLRNHGKEFIL
ncbi:phosphotransferase [Alkalicoccobacillus plakortidis]|uniref:Phosphotransferase n=1 Tax=Alkalicoccobacillus plakortidis TaxID=444060 RepID=A0ABT0XHX4_9BACI|nr:phosphotransferase [Alkalicoccobacillus plakortidis]MCM2675506.1 phosphotransferase [Alkalicoccobacillus plakortidis]